MYYFIYKITNLINGMMYIGAHSTTNIDDGYLGTGVNLKKAIKKFGKENFTREILEFAKNRDELFELERLIVNESVVNSPWFYNMVMGGRGGGVLPDSDVAKKLGKKRRIAWESMSEKDRIVFSEKMSNIMTKVMNTDEMRKKIRKALANRPDCEKEKQYQNISKGLKEKFQNMTAEEREERRQLKKEIMSNPTVRKKISESLKNSKFIKSGYENIDFVRRWGPRYDMIAHDVIPLFETKMFNIDIYNYIKEKYGFGVNIDKLLEYYEYKSLIIIIDRVKIQDLNTKTKVYKIKTFIERR